MGHVVKASKPRFPKGGSYVSFSLMYSTETLGRFASGGMSTEWSKEEVVLSTARRSDFTELISCLIF